MTVAVQKLVLVEAVEGAKVSEENTKIPGNTEDPDKDLEV